MQNLRNSLLLLIFLNIFQTAYASVGSGVPQSDDFLRPYYRAWVYSHTNSTPLKGYIYQTSDSSVVFVKNRELSQMQEIPVSQISKITFRRVNSPWVWALAGAGIGVIGGAIFGDSDGDSEPNGVFYLTADDKALLGAVIFFPIGLVVGFGLGFIKKRRKLSGNLQNYERERTWIQRFTLTKK